MHHPQPTIGFPAESGPHESRTLLPHLARTLTDAGFHIIAEPGLGTGSGQPDTALPQVDFRPAEQVWAASGRDTGGRGHRLRLIRLHNH